MDLYVLVNNEQQGPFTPQQIKGYLSMGHFQATDLAWHEGLSEWKPLEQFPEFAPKQHRVPNYKSMAVRQIAAAPPKKDKGGLMATVALVLILAAAGGGGYYFWHAYQQKKAAEAEAAAAAAAPAQPAGPAEPTTLEALNRWYEEPPAGQNAATLFQQGFDALQLSDSDKNSTTLPLLGKSALPAFTSPLSGVMKTTIHGFLERNQSAWGAFEKASQSSGSRYPLDLTQLGLALPHLPKVRQASQFGALYAVEQAEAHQGAQAARGVFVALAAQRSLEPEPLLISQLTRAACGTVAMDALEQVVNRTTLPPDALARLQGVFAQSADYDSAGTGFNRALVGERVNVLALFDQPPDKLRETLSRLAGLNTKGAASTQNLDRALANLKEQRQYFQDSINQVLTARKDAFPNRLTADNVMAPRLEEARTKNYTVFVLVAPSLGKLTSREAISLAHLRLAQTALTLERFRAANQRYPDSLNDLAPKSIPAVPQDPFDGQPLRYKKGGEGYLLYSIGPDVRDDGGVRKVGSDDITFTVPKPPRAS